MTVNATMWYAPPLPEPVVDVVDDVLVNVSSVPACWNMTTLAANATSLLGAYVTANVTEQLLLEAFFNQHGYTGAFVNGTWVDLRMFWFNGTAYNCSEVNATFVNATGAACTTNGSLPLPTCQHRNVTTAAEAEEEPEPFDPRWHWPQRRVELGGAGVMPPMATVDALEWVFRNLSASVDLGVEVRAANRFGEGPWGALQLFNFTPAVPVVTNLQVEAYAGTWATISWQTAQPSTDVDYVGFEARSCASYGCGAPV